jgi:hypothetical protein
MDELAQRVAALIRAFEHDAARIAHDEWRDGYMHGHEEASHEICRNDKQAAGPLPATAECDDEKI